MEKPHLSLSRYGSSQPRSYTIPPPSLPLSPAKLYTLYCVNINKVEQTAQPEGTKQIISAMVTPSLRVI